MSNDPSNNGLNAAVRPARSLAREYSVQRLMRGGTCNLCAAAGKRRFIKTETVRIDHLVNYHNRCDGCAFVHERHAGPCATCNCGHPVEEAAQ